MDMSAQVAQATIFLPVLVVVALTVIAFFRMVIGRAQAAKTVDVNFYRTYQGVSGESEFTIVGVRHYGNLFEAPTIFYAGCLTAFVLGAVTPWMLVFAWGYVVLRLVQSAIHLTINNPAPRGFAFTLSWLFLIAMWVDIALVVNASLSA